MKSLWTLVGIMPCLAAAPAVADTFGFTGVAQLSVSPKDANCAGLKQSQINSSEVEYTIPYYTSSNIVHIHYDPNGNQVLEIVVPVSVQDQSGLSSTVASFQNDEIIFTIDKSSNAVTVANSVVTMNGPAFAHGSETLSTPYLLLNGVTITYTSNSESCLLTITGRLSEVTG